MGAAKFLMWLVVAAMASRAVGFATMAWAGYDFDSPFQPLPGSTAEIGLILTVFAEGAVYGLAVLIWLILSATVVAVRHSLPVDQWDHGAGAVWAWWLAPVAALWMPRRVYLEILTKAWPSQGYRVGSVVNRWWVTLLATTASLGLVLVPGGPWWHLAVSATGVLMAALAAVAASTMLDLLAAPEVGTVTRTPASPYGQSTEA